MPSAAPPTTAGGPAARPLDSARRSNFARLAVVTVGVTLVLIAVGGAVRATDSGLACPTWPGCFSGGDFLPPADLNVWLEHSHRLIAGVVGLMVAAQAIWAIARFRHRAEILWPSVAAALAVVVQALLGALVVWLQLRAELVTAHLGLGMAVVGCLLFVAVAANRPRTTGTVDLRVARTSLAVAGLTLVQILVGGHVTGLGAGLAFVDGFPWLGIVAFAPVESEGDAYNVAHRALAVVLVVAIGALALAARRAGARVQDGRCATASPAASARRLRWRSGDARSWGWRRTLPAAAAALVGVQVLLGVANLANGLSWVSVIPHLAVASWIWAVLVVHTTLAYREPAASPMVAGVPAAVERSLAGSDR